MGVLTTIAAVVLLVELGLTAISAATGLQAWVRRMHDIAQVDLTRGAQLVVFVGCVVAQVAIVRGFSSTPSRRLGGALAATAAAAVLFRQLRRTGSPPAGNALGPYTLFLFCGALLALAPA